MLRLLGIQCEPQLVQEPLGQALATPTAQALVDSLPGPQPSGRFRNGVPVASFRMCPFYQLSGVSPATAAAQTGAKHEGRKQLPLRVAEFVPPYRRPSP
jgi:hypothetical protein